MNLEDKAILSLQKAARFLSEANKLAHKSEFRLTVPVGLDLLDTLTYLLTHASYLRNLIEEEVGSLIDVPTYQI